MYKGLKQSFVAKKANIKENTFSKIESGYQKPSLIQLEKIANALEVPISVFFQKTEPVLLNIEESNTSMSILSKMTLLSEKLSKLLEKNNESV